VLYVNGTEILRRSLPGGTVTYITTASSHESGAFETIDLTPYLAQFVKGVNAIQVEVHQDSGSSSDLVWDASLSYVLGSGAANDADQDGLPDDWETANGLSPSDPNGSNGAQGDPDSDGMTNIEEFIADTRPKNASSRLAIVRFQPQGGQALITWTGGPNSRQYLKQCSRSPGSSNSWTTVCTVQPLAPLTNQWLSGSLTDRMFYRVTAERP
jgi:hypothetical protein